MGMDLTMEMVDAARESYRVQCGVTAEREDMENAVQAALDVVGAPPALLVSEAERQVLTAALRVYRVGIRNAGAAADSEHVEQVDRLLHSLLPREVTVLRADVEKLLGVLTPAALEHDSALNLAAGRLENATEGRA